MKILHKIVSTKKLIAVLTCTAFAPGFAQELNLPVATQYLADNPFVVSPIYAGIGDNARIRLNGFSQWVGIKDAPNNQALYADLRILNQSGIGINVYNDKNGNTQQMGGKISFAHHITLDYPSRQYLSFGLSYNLNTFKINPNFNVNDISVVDNRYVANNNFDVGLLYRYKNYFVTVNASNLLTKDITKFYQAEPNLLRNYQIYAGYVYKKNRDARFEIEPSGYFQYFESDGRSVTDANIKLRYLDNQRTGYLWGGFTYRMLNDQYLKPLTLGPMVGLKKGGFYAGYSYQLNMNELVAYNSGTHMITIGWDFFQGLSNCACTQNTSE